MTDPAFQGWSDAALEFFAGLETDNSKAYWLAHKPFYEAEVRAPMEALLAELEPRFGAGRIMRPYRDTRFSKDKTVYRTTIGARVGGSFVQLSARGLGAGGGYYHLASEQLIRYRAAVDDDRTGGELVAITDELEALEIDVAGPDALKRSPRGYPADHPRAALLRQRGLIAWKQWPHEPWLATPAAAERVAELLETIAPLRAWLGAHVGD